MQLQPCLCTLARHRRSVLTLVQISSASTATPITAEAQLHYEEGWNLYTSNNFKDAAVCLRKAAVLKHPLAAALLSELLFWGRTSLAIDKEASLKLALDGTEMGCAHCKGMLATHLWLLQQDEEKSFEHEKAAEQGAALAR